MTLTGLALLQPQLPEPIIIDITKPAEDPLGLGNVLVSALGLSGVLALAAILAGVGFAVILFWSRSRSS
jgi:hypothetical protein